VAQPALLVLTEGITSVVALIFILLTPLHKIASGGRMIYRWHSSPLILLRTDEFGKNEF
jgi:hypothetical protein